MVQVHVAPQHGTQAMITYRAQVAQVGESAELISRESVAGSNPALRTHGKEQVMVRKQSLRIPATGC